MRNKLSASPVGLVSLAKLPLEVCELVYAATLENNKPFRNRGVLLTQYVPAAGALAMRCPAIHTLELGLEILTDEEDLGLLPAFAMVFYIKR
ncbi:hypothetical protein PTNB29_06156 [Pyrenophora teres f. teres]|nr:hypothetical protein PTNB29_06156 [Pyrenophora teres f. teres]